MVLFSTVHYTLLYLTLTSTCRCLPTPESQCSKTKLHKAIIRGKGDSGFFVVFSNWWNSSKSSYADFKNTICRANEIFFLLKSLKMVLFLWYGHYDVPSCDGCSSGILGYVAGSIPAVTPRYCTIKSIKCSSKHQKKKLCKKNSTGRPPDQQ